MNQITIVMYHFVRELKYTRYPQIKGLLTSQFREQLAYMEKYYQFVTVNDCIDAIYSNGELPSNAILLTFDDAYIDHCEGDDYSLFPQKTAPVTDKKNKKLLCKAASILPRSPG